MAAPMDVWFALAILTAFLWGVGGIFAKASTPRLGVARVALLIASIESILYVCAYMLWREDESITLGEAVFATLSCLAGIVGFLCFFESIMEGQVAIAGTIAAAYPVVAVVGAILFLSESLTATQAVGVLAVIAGILGLSYERNPELPSAMNRRSLVFAFLAFALWGIWSLTSKMAVDAVGPGNLFVFYAGCALTAPVLYAFMTRASGAPPAAASCPSTFWILGAIGIIVNVAGTYTFTFALETGSASLAVPVSSAYPIVTIALAIAILKERIDWFQAVALASCVSGLVMIGASL